MRCAWFLALSGIISKNETSNNNSDEQKIETHDIKFQGYLEETSRGLIKNSTEVIIWAYMVGGSR